MIILIALLTVLMSSFAYAQDIQYSIPPGIIGMSLDTEFIARAALFLGMLLLWTIFVGKALKLFLKIPVIAGQIIGGILLGPSLINIAGWHYFREPLYLLDFATGEIYSFVSSDLFLFFLVIFSSVFTISYLLWNAGHETDIRDMIRVGVAATVSGLLGALIPIVSTACALYWFWPTENSIEQAIGMGLIFSATSVSIPVAMLFARNKMHLRSSKATLGAAIIDDIFAVILLSLFFIFLQSGTLSSSVGVIAGPSSITVGEALVYMLISFATLVAVGFFCIPPVMRWLKKNHYSYMIAPIATAVMLLYFACAELVGGLAGITGAYFAGLFHRIGEPGHRAEKVFSPFVNNVMLPFFLGSIGLGIDISILSKAQWYTVLVLLVMSIISKLCACYIGAGISSLVSNDRRWSLSESYVFGSSMVARGEVGLVIATILYGSRLISPEYYTIALVVIVLTTIASPIMLNIGFSYIDSVSNNISGGKYALNIGLFNVIGTRQLFNIIVGHAGAMHQRSASIAISEGRRVLTIDGLDLKIILCPDKGIIFKGDKKVVDGLVGEVKEAIYSELEGMNRAE